MTDIVKGIRLVHRSSLGDTPLNFYILDISEYNKAVANRTENTVSHGLLTNKTSGIDDLFIVRPDGDLEYLGNDAVKVNIGKAFIPSFSVLHLYAKEDLVVNEGRVYVRNTGGKGPWLDSDWKELTVGMALTELWKYSKNGEFEERKQGATLVPEAMIYPTTTHAPDTTPDIYFPDMDIVTSIDMSGGFTFNAVGIERTDTLGLYIKPGINTELTVLSGSAGASIAYSSVIEAITITFDDGSTAVLPSIGLNDGGVHKVIIDLQDSQITLSIDDVEKVPVVTPVTAMTLDAIGDLDTDGHIFAVTLSGHASWLMNRIDDVTPFDLKDYIGSNNLVPVAAAVDIPTRAYIAYNFVGE